MNSEVSRAYSKALVELAEKENVNIAEELTKLQVIINENNNLEVLLFSELFTIEEKTSVLDEILNRLKLSSTVCNFLHFLLQEKRIQIFPLIYKDIIVAEDHKRGFLRGTIEGKEEKVDPELKKKLSVYLAKKLNKNTELDYVQNKSITAGYKVTVDDLQLDASLDNQFNKFKESVLNS